MRLIRRRETWPVEIVEAMLERIAAVEPRIHAWETLDGEQALETARDVSRASRDLPLLGVPVGVKDIYLTGGLRTTASFPPFANLVPEHDAGAVMRLRQGGAVILGKTVTTQFAMADPPRTRNPWNAERTPGGSSSGSAAAVAARMVPLAMGSQTKGSVLRPAGYCGVIGFKPTFGRVSRRNVFPVSWSFDTMGVICRSVEDAALALAALAGRDPADPSTSHRPVDDYLAAFQAPRSTPPRLGLIRDYLDRSEPIHRANVERAIGGLEGAGAELVELRLPMDFELVTAVHDVILHVEVAAGHRQLLARERASYAPLLLETLDAGALIPGPSYVQAQRLRRRFREGMRRLLERVDAVLTPTASNVAPSAATTGDTTFQAPWTQLGLPAISLPAGLNGEGLPLSIQLAASPWSDAALLSTARWVEQALGPMPAPL